MDYKIVFLGPTGAGKTTAIGAIASSPPVRTEAPWAGEDGDKSSTTVALDYGERLLRSGNRLRLYGLPGQRRFRYLWQRTCLGALGLAYLTDARSLHTGDAFEDLCEMLRAFADLPTIVGVTHCDLAPEIGARAVVESLRVRNLQAPVTCLDARQEDDVVTLLEGLLVESNARASVPA